MKSHAITVVQQLFEKYFFYFGFLPDFDVLQGGKQNHRKSRCNMLRKHILIRFRSKD